MDKKFSELVAVACAIIEKSKRYGLNLRDCLGNTIKTIVVQGPAAVTPLTAQAEVTLPAKNASKVAA